jgi:hypothetical protein
MNYASITQFVIRINWTGFPCTGDDSSVITIKFHTVSSTPTMDGLMSDSIGVQSVAQLKV